MFYDRVQLQRALTHLRQDTAYRTTLAVAARHAFEANWSEKVVVPGYLEIVRAAAERRGATQVARALAKELTG